MTYKQNRSHRPWKIVAGCCCIQGSVLGLLVNCRGLFFEPVCADLGFNIGGFTAYGLFYGLACVIAIPTAAKVLEATQRIVEKNHLTTMMITHNMRDAISYGNRLIMMYEGHVVVDVSGEEKKNLTVEQLLNLFSRASGSDEADDKLLLS